MTHLIGICGYAGVGKTTAAEYLSENYDYMPLAFADPLKEACAAAFGIPLNNFHSSELKEQIDTFWGVSPRKIAQFVGTEMFRNLSNELLSGIDTNFWIARLQKEIATNSYSKVVVSDVRFQNEVDWVVKSGGWILHIIRPGKHGNVGISKDGKVHASEQINSLALNLAKTYTVYNIHDLTVFYSTLDNFINVTQLHR